MSNEEYRKGIEKIANHYGAGSQTLKLIEEMGELQTAVIKFHLASVETSEDTKKLIKIGKNLLEEIADVEIMLEQIKYLTDCEDLIEQEKEYKILRQLERIKSEKQNGIKSNNR